MRSLLLFLLKFFAFSVGFFFLWLLIEEHALSALARIVLVPVTLFGYRPTGFEVVGKTIRFISSIQGRTCSCDVELAPLGFIIFLSLAFSTSPVAWSRRLKGIGLGLLLLACFHVLYLSVRVLLFAPGGFRGAGAYFVRFFVPAGVLLPIALWLVLFPTSFLRTRERPKKTLRQGVCPICGSQREDMLAHVSEAHGKGKTGLKNPEAKRYFEAFRPGGRAGRGRSGKH